MRRIVIYASLIVALAVGVIAYWLGNRTLTVERASIGAPPGMPVFHHENLVGRKAPWFAAVDRNGQPIGTASLRGRVVVVNVWATWCRPCREEMPRIEREVWQRFRPDVAVVAFAQGEGLAIVEEFNRHANLTFALVPDPRSEVARRFGGDDAIPRTYVIDRSGTIVYQALGYGEKGFAEVVSAVQRAVAEK
jgi:peroxiredoxin